MSRACRQTNGCRHAVRIRLLRFDNGEHSGAGIQHVSGRVKTLRRNGGWSSAPKSNHQRNRWRARRLRQVETTPSDRIRLKHFDCCPLDVVAGNRIGALSRFCDSAPAADYTDRDMLLHFPRTVHFFRTCNADNEDPEYGELLWKIQFTRGSR